MYSRLIILFIAFGFALFSSHTISPAAQITRVTDKIYNCIVRIEGVIEKGDAEKFSAIVDVDESIYQSLNSWADGKQQRVCLNSPGGSFLEGIKIARKVVKFNLGTAISRNERCESACAIVFMAGRVEFADSPGTTPDRLLHPLGKLGFHAPSLLVSQGSYQKEQVESAYKIALIGISDLLSISETMSFSNLLLEKMIRTPPDTMLYLDTIAQAGLWNVMIAPTRMPRLITKFELANVCQHWHQVFGDVSTEKSTVKLLTTDKNGLMIGGQWVTSGQDGDYCKVSIPRYPPLKPIAIERLGWVSFLDDAMPFFPSLLYPGSTRISELAPGSDIKVETRFSESQKSIFKKTNKKPPSLKGECRVYKNAKVIDSDPCTRLNEVKTDSSGNNQKISYFVWPSGGKTVVVETLGGVLINGSKSSDTIHSKDRLGICVVNSKSGNRFCFRPNR